MRAMPLDENWFENERLHRAAADGDCLRCVGC
jgi:hypothetical protein